MKEKNVDFAAHPMEMNWWQQWQCAKMKLSVVWPQI
jgi:hypothetical protein